MQVSNAQPNRRLLYLLAGTVALQAAVFATIQLTRDPSRLTASAIVSQIEAANETTVESSPLVAPTSPEAPVTESVAPTVAEPAVVQYRIARGDTLTKIWTNHDAPYAGALKAAEAIQSQKLSLGIFRVGDQVQLTFSPEGDIVRLEKELRVGKTLILEGNASDGYEARIVEADTIEVERTVSGVIDRSFALAAAASELPYEVVDELVDLFSQRIEFTRDVHAGDRYAVIFTERRLADGTFHSVGSIRAAVLESGGKPYYAVHHEQKDGSSAFFDEQGNALGNYFLRYPLKFTRISSTFSNARFHPVLARMKAHRGVDFAAPIGTPVRAVADAVVVLSGWRGGAGKMVRLKHSDRFTTEYMHLHTIKSGIKTGARVKRGEVIGTVGMTGLATGPHLHFGLFDRGRYVDPLKTDLPNLAPEHLRIPKDYLLATIQTLRDVKGAATMVATADSATAAPRG